MRKVIHLLLLLAVALLSSQYTGVHGAELRNKKKDAPQSREERIAKVQSIALERELQRRRQGGGGRQRGRGRGGGGGGGGKGKGKGGKGKGGGMSGSKGRNIDLSRLRFLPDRFDPIPFVNCIPLPPGYLDGDGGGGGKKGKKGGSMSSKGKGKGKGHRRNRRGNMNHRIRERVLRSSRSHHGKGRIGGRGRNRGGNRRQGARANRNGPPNMNNGMMMGGRLPYCPISAPTIFPTNLPSFTPIPTATPLPSITPFPSYTPLPSGDSGDGPGPTSPGAPPSSPDPPSSGPPGPDPPGPDPPGPPDTPTVPAPPTVAAPVAIPAGTERILVESRLEFGFFDGVTARQPTQEEIDGVMAQTTMFYEMILREAFPTLESFEAVFVPPDEFNAGNNLPVLLNFDANAFFPEGGDSPTAAEVFAVLEGADYMNFITMYVWNSEPVGAGNIFFETQEVAYNARVAPA